MCNIEAAVRTIPIVTFFCLIVTSSVMWEKDYKPLTLHNIKIIIESSEIMNRLLNRSLFLCDKVYRDGGGYGTSTVTVFYGGSTV